MTRKFPPILFALLALLGSGLDGRRALADPPPAGLEALERKVETLAAELLRLREELSVPETDRDLQGQYGLGPSASKVYAVDQGISMGGYGEFYFEAPLEDTELTGDRRQADFYRFIAYLGYKFSDRILMNTELEFEHATTSSNFEGDGGSVSVEFSYLEFLLHESFNLRAGNLLLPSGLVNEMHEPPFYRGNFRPEVERRLIPSTWRELGLGAHGRIAGDWRYSAYLLNGLNGAKFDEKGIRGGRQKGNQTLWEDVAGLLALDFSPDPSLRLGGSLFHGGADHDGLVDAGGESFSVSNTLWELHGEWRRGGLATRALVAGARIDGARELSERLYDEPDDTKLVPEEQLGWYLEAAYDVAPLLLENASFALRPWLRYERLDLQREVPELAGHTANPQLSQEILTLGVEMQPHPSVVLKLDWVHSTNDADTPTSDALRVGAGFVY